MKKMKRNFLALIMAVVMACGTSTVAFAAEMDNTTNVETAYNEQSSQTYATTYVNRSGSFLVASDVISCDRNMGSGNYTVTYSVSKPCTLIFWIDSYTCYDVCTLSGSGTTTVSVPLLRTIRGWQLWATDNSSNVSYSLKITK